MNILFTPRVCTNIIQTRGGKYEFFQIIFEYTEMSLTRTISNVGVF